ncbi:hypothetical protein ACHAXT_008597 [Thalassiosira profunda]
MPLSTPLDEIARAVGPRLDLWQSRDWPHRRGDEITLDLLSFPLTETSPGRRPVACENCGQECMCIHDNVLCWKCKGCFCYHCTNADEPSGVTIPGLPAGMQVMNPSLDTPMARILERGFGACPSCQEPLRSIAMIDVFRQMMESMSGSGSGQRRLPNTGESLVQEAEDALKRADDARGSGNSESAISEYTHAINAINYVASASKGVRLVLRAKDILLIAHAERALLEGNTELRSAILNAFPTASVRKCDGEVRKMTKSTFESLFYPLPANVMVGAGTFLRIDMRDDTKDRAFESKEWAKQLQLLNVREERVRYYVALNKQTCPSLDGIDELFDSLRGLWQGLWVHQCYEQAMSSTISLGDHSFSTGMVIQFVRVFPTDTAAQEYTRLIAERKRIGEEGHHNEDAALKKKLKGLIKRMGVDDFHKVTVLKGDFGPMSSISVVVAVRNVSTKVFVQSFPEEVDFACHLVGKAVLYLEQRLQESRNNPRDAAHHHPDLTICAYCGKFGKHSLKTCT